MTAANFCRFRDDLAALGWQPGDRLGLAVSGGPDSLALLLLAHAALPDAIEAATVDHGLRAAAAVECAFVAEICARLGVPHATLRESPSPSGEGLGWGLSPNAPPSGKAAPPTPPLKGRGVQAAASTLRHALLAEWRVARKLDWIATAHHRDDQAETVLMRVNRGSGTAGLAGIRPRVGRTLRPLLGWSRAELRSVVDAAGIVPVDDPSNRDPRYDRTAVRALLADQRWLDPARLARVATIQGEADDALDWMIDRLWGERHRDTGFAAITLDPHDLPRELRRRLVARALDHVRVETGLPEPLRPDRIDRLLESLEHGRTATLAGVKATAATAGWHFAPAPPRRATHPSRNRSG